MQFPCRRRPQQADRQIAGKPRARAGPANRRQAVLRAVLRNQLKAYNSVFHPFDRDPMKPSEPVYNMARGKLPADLRNWLDGNQIEEIEAVVPDMTGAAKGKILPAKKYQEEVGIRMPESIFGQTVDGDFPTDWNVLGETDGDMFLKPDPATVRPVPYAKDPTAVIIHDCFHFDGAPVEVAPRQVLRNVLGLYTGQGWDPIIAPEVEFYLVEPNSDADLPLKPPVGQSGRPEAGRQSFSIDAVNEFDPLFEDLYDYCDLQDIGIETLIHESGLTQMEINLLHGQSLELADQVFLFKRGLRSVALRHGIYATFMAAPMEGQPGSAMHLHQSIVDSETGQEHLQRCGRDRKQAVPGGT